MPKKESALQANIKRELISLGWHVEVMSCNQYQFGIPDLYLFKVIYEDNQPVEYHRWVDIKRPKGSTLTKRQCQKWPLWESKGLGIWILDAVGQEHKLFEPCNWREWWKPRYEKYVSKKPEDILKDLL